MSLTGRVVPSEKILVQGHIVSVVILFLFNSNCLTVCKFDHMPEGLSGLVIFIWVLCEYVHVFPLS